MLDYCSKVPRVQSHSNWYHQMENVDSVKVKYVSELILIIIRKMIRTYHVKKLDWAFSGVIFSTSLVRCENDDCIARVARLQLIIRLFVFQDDSYWWQARKEFERTARAGLIPSRALQERRIIHERTKKEPGGDAISNANIINCRNQHIFVLVVSI